MFRKLIAVILTVSLLLLSIIGLSEAGEAHTHSYDDGVVVQSPTCTEDGVMLFTCSECSDSYTAAISATGHVWDEGAVLLDPGCETAGEIAYTCSGCGLMTIEGIEPAGHIWDEGEVVQSADCIEDGLIVYTCTSCGATSEESIPALGHSFEDGVCAVCGYAMIVEEDAEAAVEAAASVDGVEYATLAEAVDAAESGAYVELLADETGAGFVINKDLTIDFGGNTYTISGSANQYIVLCDGASAVLKNGRIVTESGAEYLLQSFDAALTLTDIELDARGSGSVKCALSMNGGSVKLNGKTGVYNLEADGYCSVADDGAALTVEAGMSGRILGSLRIGEGSSVTLMGGTYSEDVSDYLPEGFFCIANDDGSYSVTSIAPLFNAGAVAQVGETTYTSLEDASKAARNADPKVFTVIADNNQDVRIRSGCTMIVPANINYTGNITVSLGYELLESVDPSDGSKLYTTAFAGMIQSASLDVTESIGIRFNVDIAEQYTNPILRVTGKGKTIDLTGTLLGSANGTDTYRFLYNELCPADMTETVIVQVVLTKNGSEMITDTFNYSIYQYCCEAYDAFKNSQPGLITVLADMLEYGAASQTFKGNSSNLLPNTPDWVAANKTSQNYIAYSDETFISPLLNNVYIDGASLVINDYIQIKFTLHLSNPETQTVELSRMGTLVDSDSYTLSPAAGSNGVYTLLTDTIAALGMDDIYTLDIKENGKTLDHMTYSVRSYVNAAQTIPSIADLTQKMYNFGCSGKIFSGKALYNTCTAVTANKTSIELNLTDKLTEQLWAITTPSAGPQSVTWASEDKTIAKVKSSGLVTAVGVGETTISVTTKAGNCVGYCTVKVTELPTSGFTWDEDANVEDGIVITGYNGDISEEITDEGVITIPAKINGIPVTSIADDAFTGNTLIEEIIMPNSIEVIGARAFANCTNLKSMTCYD